MKHCFPLAQGFSAAVLVSVHLLEFDGLQNSYLSWAPWQWRWRYYGHWKHL